MSPSREEKRQRIWEQVELAGAAESAREQRRVEHELLSCVEKGMKNAELGSDCLQLEMQRALDNGYPRSQLYWFIRLPALQRSLKQLGIRIRT